MLLELETLPSFGIHFPRTIYSTLADRLVESTCREKIVEYYNSLESKESQLNIELSSIHEGDDVVRGARLKDVSKDLQEWLECPYDDGEKLVECLEKEIAAEG